MSTKNQVKPKHTFPKRTPGEDEIIEIEEIPSTKPVKVQISQKRKENIENSSSEATTPNKKTPKDKNDEDLIEIMDVDVPQIDLGKKKPSAQSNRQKKSISKINANNDIKKEKLAVQSINLINVKEKFPINKGKKENKLTSITLDESDGDIKVTKELKTDNTIKKNIKSQEQISTNIIQEIAITPEKIIKRNTKDDKKNKKNEKQQEIELLSEDSGNEKKKERKNKKISQKKNKNNNNSDLVISLTSDKINSGFLSSTKASKKNQRKSYKRENKKSKSTIKLSSKKEFLDSKMNNLLLGRKRKQDKKTSKSITPNKRTNNYRSSNKENSNLNAKIPIKSSKNRTPIKITEKNNYRFNDLFSPNDEIVEQGTEKNLLTPELAVLDQLVNEYGLERVIDSLCKSKLNQKSKLDSCLQGLKDSCYDNKINFILFKMLFSYFDSKLNKNGIKDEKEKRPFSFENLITSTESKNEKSRNDKPKSPIKSKPKVLPIINHIEGSSPIQINDEEVQNPKKNEKIINSSEKNKNKSKSNRNDKNMNTNIPNEVEKKSEKKTMSIGSHYKKNDEGQIYKYQVSNVDGKGNAIFKCYDDNCNGMGIYELETMKFSMTRKHNIKHSEHDYIVNSDKDGDEVFKQLIEKEKSDAQVFKENGERIVKYY